MATDNLFDVYVAGAYSAPEHLAKAERRAIHAARFDALTYYAGVLMHEGLTVFSPISHSHPIALAHPGMSTYTEWWIRQDAPGLFNSRFLHILCDGSTWKESSGVMREMQIAVERSIEIWYVLLNGMDCTECGHGNKHIIVDIPTRSNDIRYCPACWAAIVARGERSE